MSQSSSETLYFQWLCGLVEQGATPGRNHYSHLLKSLFDKEFTCFVPNDDNRIGDGLELRKVWYRTGIDFMSNQLEKPCSVLEIIIALALRMEDILYEPDKPNRTNKWFWMMIDNLSLSIFNDRAYAFDPEGSSEEVGLILQTWLDRSYDRNGVGGLFPIQHSREDQRKVEIWYQMQAYLAQMFTS